MDISCIDRPQPAMDGNPPKHTALYSLRKHCGVDDHGCGESEAFPVATGKEK
ncbi:hypothetical protein KIN20_010522 [Parelaphostrongylus tenuis]|uniref:Uncharacterized protein n=1 Tax=Parelaphostrongylus tenuis TaxID=148309 RepID=A0AAD5QC58_PARTN|nr:hypothetical protein KIN20_000861 [Parelaphostrongylus tenuis]KAJ1353782.1 hypothetical protein KIN20_010522 [Parelaphostrongylus tenuis]